MDNQLICSRVIANSGIAFGTSGARGLVENFTPAVCAAFSVAFIKSIDTDFRFNSIALAIDNRPSSYAMAQACAEGAKQLNIEPVFYGVIPTPGLAFKAMHDSMPCIMVTGSHIPFDRNGLKFYRPDGEITKEDELAISNNDATFRLPSQLSALVESKDAVTAYTRRYTDLFNQDALAGKKIGIYEHSSAGRDIYKKLFEKLGARVTSLERSDTFVPIDTEAVSIEDKQKAIEWSKQYGFDAIFSTDGDGDRPLIADENGNWLNGDTLGLLTSQLLDIEALAVPVSCNTAIERTCSFKKVMRTKIGSPYVISEFVSLNQNFTRVAGFEANGGYLLGSNITVNNNLVAALPTRDALLPALMLLSQKESIAEQFRMLPKRYTASDRLQNFPKEKSVQIIDELKRDANPLLLKLGCESGYELNTTDGLRIIFSNDDIVHLRPSGNAPELRCYAESSSEEYAKKLVATTFAFIQS